MNALLLVLGVMTPVWANVPTMEDLLNTNAPTSSLLLRNVKFDGFSDDISHSAYIAVCNRWRSELEPFIVESTIYKNNTILSITISKSTVKDDEVEVYLAISTNDMDKISKYIKGESDDANSDLNNDTFLGQTTIIGIKIIEGAPYCPSMGKFTTADACVDTTIIESVQADVEMLLIFGCIVTTLFVAFLISLFIWRTKQFSEAQKEIEALKKGRKKKKKNAKPSLSSPNSMSECKGTLESSPVQLTSEGDHARSLQIVNNFPTQPKANHHHRRKKPALAQIPILKFYLAGSLLCLIYEFLGLAMYLVDHKAGIGFQAVVTVALVVWACLKREMRGTVVLVFRLCIGFATLTATLVTGYAGTYFSTLIGNNSEPVPTTCWYLVCGSPVAWPIMLVAAIYLVSSLGGM